MKRVVAALLIWVCTWSVVFGQDSLYQSFLKQENELLKSQSAIRLGVRLFDMGMLDSSLYFFQFPLEINSSDPAILKVKAESSFWMGFANYSYANYSAAILAYETAKTNFEALEIQHKVGECNWYQGFCYALIGDFQNAMVHFEQANARYTDTYFPENVFEFYHDWGYSLWLNGNYTDAVYFFDKALTLGPNDPAFTSKVLNLKGAAFRFLEQYDQAQEAYLKAIQLAKDQKSIQSYGWPINNLGELYETLGDLGAAINQYQQVIELTAEFDFPVLETYARTNLASVYSQQKEWASALPHVQKALALSRDFENKQDYIVALKLGVSVAHYLGRHDLYETWFAELNDHTISRNEHERLADSQEEKASLEKGLLTQENEALKKTLAQGEDGVFTESFIAGLAILLALVAGLFMHHRLRLAVSREQAVTHQMKTLEQESQAQQAAIARLQKHVQDEQADHQAAYHRHVGRNKAYEARIFKG